MNILWKDRKRICGLPVTFTKYSYDAERLLPGSCFSIG